MHLQLVPRIKRIYSGVFPLLLQQSVEENVKIYPVPFNIALMLPSDDADSEYPQRALNYIYSSSVSRKLSAIDLLNPNSESMQNDVGNPNRTILYRTEYVRMCGISFRHRVNLLENRLKLDMSKMSDFSSMANMSIMSTETLLGIAKSIYSRIIQEPRFGARYEEFPYSNIDIGRPVDVDAIADLNLNGIWQFDEAGRRINNLDLFAWMRQEYAKAGSRTPAVRKQVINKLIHIVSIYTIYYVLKDFCFQDVVVESKDLSESITRFMASVDGFIVAEYRALMRINVQRDEKKDERVTFEQLQERDEGTTTYASLIIPDLLRLLERLYYGEWISHIDGELLCDYTVQPADFLEQAGLAGVQNQYSAIPTKIDVNIVCFGNTVVDNNDVLLLLTNIEKIVNQLHYVFAGINVDELQTEGSVRELEGLLCTLVRGMDEYAKISSIVMENPHMNFINMIDLTIDGTEENNTVRQYVLRAVKQMFYEQLRAIVGSEPKSSRGEVNSSVLTKDGHSDESIQHHLYASLEAIIFYTTKLNNMIVNSQWGGVAEHDLMKAPTHVDSLGVQQYDIIGRKQKNVLDNMIRLRTLLTFGSMAQGNVCSLDINVQLMVGVRDLIIAYKYFAAIQDLYKVYMPEDKTVPEVTVEWLLTVADKPYNALSKYQFIEPYLTVVPDPTKEAEKIYYKTYKSISFLKTVKMLSYVVKFKNLHPKFLASNIIDLSSANMKKKAVVTGFRTLFYNSTAQDLFMNLVENVLSASNYYSSFSFATEARGSLVNDIEAERSQMSLETLHSLGKPDAAGSGMSFCGLNTITFRQRNKPITGLFYPIQNNGIMHKQYQMYVGEQSLRGVQHFGASAEQILKGKVDQNVARSQYVLYDTFNPRVPVILSEFSVMHGYVGQVSKMYNIPYTQGMDDSEYNMSSSRWGVSFRNKTNSYYAKYLIDNISLSFCRDISAEFYPTMDFDFKNIYLPSVSESPPTLPEKNVSRLYPRLIDMAHRVYSNNRTTSKTSTGVAHIIERPGNMVMYEVLSEILEDIKVYTVQQGRYVEVNDVELRQNALNNMDLYSLLDLINQGIEYQNMQTILSAYDLMMYLQENVLQSSYDQNTGQVYYYVMQGNEVKVVNNIHRIYDVAKRGPRITYVQEIGYKYEIESAVSNLCVQLRMPLAIYDKLINAKTFNPEDYRPQTTVEELKSEATFTHYADSPVELIYDRVRASEFGGDYR